MDRITTLGLADTTTPLTTHRSVPQGFNPARNNIVINHGSLRKTAPAEPNSSQDIGLAIRQAWGAVYSASVPDLRAICDSFEETLTGRRRPPGSTLIAELELASAIALALADRRAAALALAKRACSCAPTPALNRLAAKVVRFCQWIHGDPEPPYCEQGAVLQNEPSWGRIVDSLELSMYAAVEMSRLNFSIARRLATDALELARLHSDDSCAAAALAGALLVQLSYEEGNVAQADRLLSETVLRADRNAPIESLIRTYPLLARIASLRGNDSKARRICIDGETRGRSNGCGRLGIACLQERITLHLKSDQLEEARACARAIDYLARDADPDRHSSWIQTQAALAEARLASATTPSASAAGVFGQLHLQAVRTGDLFTGMTLALYWVEALLLNNAVQDGADVLAKVLEGAIRSGAFQSFTDSGPNVRSLLVSIYHQAHPKHQAFLPLLSTMIRHLARGTVYPQVQSVRSPKVTLTPRERSVLRLICSGLSNKGIARELSIAPETVKSHAKHIMGKLNARTRAEAVARAVGMCLN